MKVRPHESTAAGRQPDPDGGAPLDGDSVEQIVRDHQRSVRGFLRYLGCPLRVVDDLAQETFLTFLSSSEFEVRSERATSRYLRTIARHLFLKALRKSGSDVIATDLEAAEEAWVRYHDHDRGPYLDALQTCLAGVSGKARTALDLRYGDDLGQQAIAQEMALTESGVHSLLVRARKKLRACIESKLGSNGEGRS